MKLYQAVCFIDDFEHSGGVFDGMPMTIFRAPGEPIYKEEDYKKMICGFDCLEDDEKQYMRIVIDEFFTEREVKEVKKYLKTFPKTKIQVREISLPHRAGFLPISAIPLGGGQDCYMFYQSKDYSLSFKIEGYFDVRDLNEKQTRNDEATKKENDVPF